MFYIYALMPDRVLRAIANKGAPLSFTSRVDASDASKRLSIQLGYPITIDSKWLHGTRDEKPLGEGMMVPLLQPYASDMRGVRVDPFGNAVPWCQRLWESFLDGKEVLSEAATEIWNSMRCEGDPTWDEGMVLLWHREG